MAPRFKRTTIDERLDNGRALISAVVVFLFLMATYGLLDKFTGQ